MSMWMNDEEQGARAARASVWVGPLVFVGALLVIPSLVIDLATTSDAGRITAFVLNVISWLTFLTEIVVMTALVEDRRRWYREHRLDVLITIVTFPLLPGVLELLRLFKVARVISLLRLVRVTRAGQLIHQITTPAGLLWSAFFAVLAILIGATTFHAVESSAQDLSTGDSMWWAVTTATTVGYGDLYPTTVWGRVVAVSLMLIGIGFVALFTAAIAGRLAEHAVQESDEEQEEQIISAVHAEVEGLRAQVAALQSSVDTLTAIVRSGAAGSESRSRDA